MAQSVINLSDALRNHAKDYPEKNCLILPNKQKYSFKDINKLVDNACIFFDSLSLKSGDLISAVINNSAEYLVLYLASLRFGTVFNPYPYTIDSKDIARYLSYVEPKIVFCQKKHYTSLKDDLGFQAFLIDDNFLNKLNTSVAIWKSFIPDSRSPACLYYSSGTTGNPKGILFSYKNMASNILSVVQGFNFNKDDNHLIVLPLGHTASINYSFLPSILCGSTIILSESFWKIRAQFWSVIDKYDISYVELVPSILLALINTPYLKEEHKNINSLRFIGCGSSMLSIEAQQKFIKIFGIKVANLYGLSETGPTHIDCPLDEGWEPGSIGKPLDVNKVKIVDSNNKELPTEEIGEILIKGDNVFIDYYKNRTLYNKVVKDGYFHTGDLGYKGKNGKYFFTGRLKELIIKGGVNISPDEIDEIIYKIPVVSEVLTIGKYDEYLGEKIISFVVVKTMSKLTSNDILTHCKNFLSREKIPDEIKFIDDIPKGHSGKFLRKKLQSLYD